MSHVLQYTALTASKKINDRSQHYKLNNFVARMTGILWAEGSLVNTRSSLSLICQQVTRQNAISFLGIPFERNIGTRITKENRFVTGAGIRNHPIFPLRINDKKPGFSTENWTCHIFSKSKALYMDTK